MEICNKIRDEMSLGYPVRMKLNVYDVNKYNNNDGEIFFYQFS